MGRRRGLQPHSGDSTVQSSPKWRNGRRAGFKIQFPSPGVWVQVPPSAFCFSGGHRFVGAGCFGRKPVSPKASRDALSVEFPRGGRRGFSADVPLRWTSARRSEWDAGCDPRLGTRVRSKFCADRTDGGPICPVPGISDRFERQFTHMTGGATFQRHPPDTRLRMARLAIYARLTQSADPAPAATGPSGRPEVPGIVWSGTDSLAAARFPTAQLCHGSDGVGRLSLSA